MMDNISEQQKTKLCLNWLQFCKSIGWKDSDMKDLVDVFWQHEAWRTYKMQDIPN